MRISFLLACFLWCYTAIAQRNFTEGSVITLKGDTLPGMVNEKDLPTNFTECEFIPAGEKEIKRFAPSEIAGYRIGSYRTFESREVDGLENEEVRKFVEVLVVGKLSLFRFKEHFIFQKDTMAYTIIVGTPPMREQSGVYTNVKSNLTNIGKLTYLFQECGPILIDHQRTKINEDKLVSLTKTYNSCMSSEYTVVRTKKPLIKVSPTIFGAAGNLKLQYDDSPNKGGDDFLKGVKPMSKSVFQVGAGIGLIFPRISENLMLDLGVNFSSFDFSETYIGEADFGNGNIGTATNDVSLTGKLTKIPILVQYSLYSKSRLTPYIRTGAIFRSVTYEEKGRNRNLSFNDVLLSEDFYDFDIVGYFPGFTISPGVQWKLGKHVAIYAQFQLEKFVESALFDNLDPDSKETNLTFKINRTDVLFGFGLRAF